MGIAQSVIVVLGLASLIAVPRSMAAETGLSSYQGAWLVTAPQQRRVDQPSAKAFAMRGAWIDRAVPPRERAKRE